MELALGLVCGFLLLYCFAVTCVLYTVSDSKDKVVRSLIDQFYLQESSKSAVEYSNSRKRIDEIGEKNGTATASAKPVEDVPLGSGHFQKRVM